MHTTNNIMRPVAKFARHHNYMWQLITVATSIPADHGGAYLKGAVTMMTHVQAAHIAKLRRMISAADLLALQSAAYDLIDPETAEDDGALFALHLSAVAAAGRLENTIRNA